MSSVESANESLSPKGNLIIITKKLLSVDTADNEKTARQRGSEVV